MKKFTLFFCVSYLAFIIPVFGAEIFLELKSSELARDQEFLINAFLDTDGEYLNAIEGRLTYPADLLEIKDVRNGNSAVNFWIEKPNGSQPGTISFSGITPGGLFGDKNALFEVVFSAGKIGSGSISFDGIKILKNDGEGTVADVKISSSRFAISEQAPESGSQVSEIRDTEIPESFSPVIGRDPEIFDGKYFLAFTAQDKGSGINHYEVREGLWGEYVSATSPYILENQSLNRKIYVKAIDEAGNERIVTFIPDQWKLYRKYILLGIILVAFIASVFAVGKLYHKKYVQNL